MYVYCTYIYLSCTTDVQCTCKLCKCTLYYTCNTCIVFYCENPPKHVHVHAPFLNKILTLLLLLVTCTPGLVIGHDQPVWQPGRISDPPRQNCSGGESHCPSHCSTNQVIASPTCGFCTCACTIIMYAHVKVLTCTYRI